MTRQGIGEALGSPPWVREGGGHLEGAGERQVCSTTSGKKAVCAGATQAASHRCSLSHLPSLVLCLEKGHRAAAYPSWEGLLLYRWERRPCRASGLASVMVPVSDND